MSRQVMQKHVPTMPLTRYELHRSLTDGENGFFNLLEHPHPLQELLHEFFIASAAADETDIQTAIVKAAWRRGQIIHIEKAQAIDLMLLALASDIPAVWQEAISGLYTLDESALQKWHDQHRSAITQEKSEWIHDALSP